VRQPTRLAALYRDMRKGREDAKDEPGAADFYYGECEMRRHDPNTPRAERLVLWMYWLLSGYGLRAWRALVSFAVVVILAGIVLAFWGFPNAPAIFRPTGVDRGGALIYQQLPAGPPPGIGRLPDAIRFSARSATALFRGPDGGCHALTDIHHQRGAPPGRMSIMETMERKRPRARRSFTPINRWVRAQELPAQATRGAGKKRVTSPKRAC
jgi:hypothetical protein